MMLLQQQPHNYHQQHPHHNPQSHSLHHQVQHPHHQVSPSSISSYLSKQFSLDCSTFLLHNYSPNGTCFVFGAAQQTKCIHSPLTWARASPSLGNSECGVKRQKPQPVKVRATEWIFYNNKIESLSNRSIDYNSNQDFNPSSPSSLHRKLSLLSVQCNEKSTGLVKSASILWFPSHLIFLPSLWAARGVSHNNKLSVPIRHCSIE